MILEPVRQFRRSSAFPTGRRGAGDINPDVRSLSRKSIAVKRLRGIADTHSRKFAFVSWKSASCVVSTPCSGRCGKKAWQCPGREFVSDIENALRGKAEDIRKKDRSGQKF
jgi:hypothetical protein